MRSTIAIEVAATPELVFRLARDVERWEILLPHYVRSRVVESGTDARVLEFIARRPVVRALGLGLPVVWRARVWSEAEGRRLRFVHVAGATKGMEVTWRIEGSPTGTTVAIDHEFAPSVPGFARFVDRWFTRPIAGRTLATFKAMAESLSDADGAEAAP